MSGAMATRDMNLVKNPALDGPISVSTSPTSSAPISLPFSPPELRSAVMRKGGAPQSKSFGEFIDDVKNGFDQAVRDTRNTISGAQQTSNEFAQRSSNYFEDFKKDPKRVGLAALTRGGSEHARAAGVETQLQIENEIKARTPNRETPPALPTPGNSAPELDEVKKEQRNRRGRATTILTGGRGVTETANTARRTLMGY